MRAISFLLKRKASPRHAKRPYSRYARDRYRRWERVLGPVWSELKEGPRGDCSACSYLPFEGGCEFCGADSLRVYHGRWCGHERNAHLTLCGECAAVVDGFEPLRDDPNIDVYEASQWQ